MVVLVSLALPLNAQYSRKIKLLPTSLRVATSNVRHCEKFLKCCQSLVFGCFFPSQFHIAHASGENSRVFLICSVKFGANKFDSFRRIEIRRQIIADMLSAYCIGIRTVSLRSGDARVFNRMIGERLWRCIKCVCVGAEMGKPISNVAP